MERRHGTMTVTSATGLKGVGSILYDGPWDAPGGDSAAAGPLRVWLGLDPGIDWARSAFVPIPQRLRPSPLNLLFRDMSGADLLPDPARLVFRGLDFDAY